MSSCLSLLNLSPHHVQQLAQGQLGISWVLSDVHSASLESTMSHLCVNSCVSSETTIIEVFSDGDWDLTLAKEVSCSCGEKLVSAEIRLAWWLQSCSSQACSVTTKKNV